MSRGWWGDVDPRLLTRDEIADRRVRLRRDYSETKRRLDRSVRVYQALDRMAVQRRSQAMAVSVRARARLARLSVLMGQVASDVQHPPPA